MPLPFYIPMSCQKRTRLQSTVVCKNEKSYFVDRSGAKALTQMENLQIDTNEISELVCLTRSFDAR